MKQSIMQNEPCLFIWKYKCLSNVIEMMIELMANIYWALIVDQALSYLLYTFNLGIDAM